MSAVSVVSDDSFWDDPIFWDRFDPFEWRHELETHLAEREEAEFTILTLVPAAEKPESPRAKRRRIMRDRLRGVRPKDEAELKTTRWYKRKKHADSGRRLKCTRTVLLHNQQGELERRIKRQRIKPVPNLRHDAGPPIELEELELKESQLLFKQRQRCAKKLRKQINAVRRTNASVHEAATELPDVAGKELALLSDPFIRERIIEDLEQDAEIGDHDLAVNLEQIDEVVYATLAAA